MFKLHKPQMSGSIHSGHFMVSRLDDEDDDNNDPADDSSESERDNANSVEIDINNPESVADVTSNLDLSYRVESPAAAKDEKLTSWNDLDRPQKHAQKQHQYLTYYTNSCPDAKDSVNEVAGGSVRVADSSASSQVVDGRLSGLGGVSSRINVSIEDRIASMNESSKDSNARGFNSHLNHLHQHHHTLQDQYQHLQLANLSSHNHHQQQQSSPLHPYHQHHPHHNNNNHQHTVTIDTTLTKLLECMSLYYSSNLTSPKWKSFKGFKLRLKYKIRLNNLIWRAWFLQCMRGRRPPGCRFNAPVETDVHKKSETTILEGKYWKRKEKAIADEYKKWRIFHKQKSQTYCYRPSSFDWDSRASNYASASGPECSFYPDYDMNITCNLDDFPPMLEDVDSPREYAQPAVIRFGEQQQQQQQQHHHNHHQQQQQPQQQQHQLQLAQMQVTASAVSLTATASSITTSAQQSALSLKQEQSLFMPFGNHHQAPQISQQNLYQHHQQQAIQAVAASYSQSHPLQLQNSHPHQQQQQYQQAQQPQAHLRPSVFPIGFDHNPLYQHLNEQLQHQPQHQQQQQHPQQQHQQAATSQPQQSITSQQQQHSQSTISNLQQQQQQQNILSPDLYPMSQGSGDCSSASSNAGGSGRNEQRRVCHINAEQKRRCNIKNGFDTLKSILPSINQSVNVKISKASMLQKAASYISALSAEQKQQAEEQALLKQQIEALKRTINTYQCQLPASGGPVGCPGSSQAREMLQEHIRRRTLENWKFWIFSLLIEPLFETYYNSVSTTSLEDSCKTIFTWLDRCCGLISLRRDVLQSLTFLSTKTNILNTPQTLPTEAVDAVRYDTSLHNHGASRGGNA